ncbi:unnamed protein product [Rotaria sordida]|uniref:Uncharacterized protein n=1 Tax=Rotaria sordida TaxID=392033 RepID=A0A814XSK6_9BILA|nr:unnamed protein product [Rotaria sordida]CAF1162798.1 unnamed protein product [Rotaria sordida]CAF1196002.1 unnamed protein product [Rotaria sordida]CAF1219828.1 unnamed protein product [Rotaria sordida]CAF1449686.1 unnamed protein product [Rotaria sordida]
MHSSRDSSPRPRLSHGTPQQQQQRQGDKLQYETFDLNDMMDKNQRDHRDVNEKRQRSDYHHHMNPWVNYPPHSCPRSSYVNDSSRFNRTNNNIRPLMEYNNPNDS